MINPHILTADEIASLQTNDAIDTFGGSRVLISGGTGMIGSNFVEKLIFGLRVKNLRPPKIHLLVRSDSNPNLQAITKCDEVTIEKCDLANFCPVSTYDFVFHAASPASPTQYGDKRAVETANTGFARALVRNKSRFGRVLFISSGEVYGPNAPTPITENYEAQFENDDGRAIYPTQKIQAETMLLNDLDDCLVARLFHSFGPGMRKNDGRSFADFVWSAAKGNPINLRSDGSDVRTFLFSGDATDGFVSIYSHGSSENAYNVGSEVPTSIKDFATMVATIGEVPISFMVNPSEEYVHSPNRVIIPSTAKLKSLGWNPKTELRSAIKSTISWASNLS